VNKNDKTNDLSTDVYKELPKLYLDINFIEWFVGFCEAESNFLIRTRKITKEK
jgi:hypothetical protein